MLTVGLSPLKRNSSLIIQMIPKIVHQTWKTDTIPEKWARPYARCRNVLSGYEFKLWTDRKAREFIADNYPDSLKNFDSYPYTIQKVDALRYFILYHYGGIYMDLDVGCLKPLDSLLSNDAIIPKTIPIGYSNDVLFASQRHPFYKQLIHALPYWNHYYLTPYPTIFFSTGPMFLTLQYFLYASTPGNTITVLPVEQYSGNDTVSYFNHYQVLSCVT